MAAVITNVPPVQRLARRPKHWWNLAFKPFIIQPCAIAPVLPGETLKSALYQCRAITESIRNPIIGWWLEHYWFYVRHRQLLTPGDFESMVLQYDYDISSRYGVDKDDTFHDGTTTVDWTWECLKVVVNEWFRADDESYTDHQVDGMPVAKIMDLPGILDSLTLDSAMTGIDLPDDIANATMGDVDLLRLQWEHLRSMQVTNMDYEDFLRTYGVKLGQAEDNRPELLRYSRAWQYPSSTVDGSTGAASSVVSWAPQERIDKDRFFREPGFIFGVTCVRPKVYLKNVRAASVCLMQDALKWLPAVLREERAVSLKELAAAAEPFPASSVASWVDVRDLLIYGDQFVNYDLSTATDVNQVALPSADMTNKEFVATTDIDALFTGATPTSLVRQDGVISLNILGTQRDTSPQSTAIV